MTQSSFHQTKPHDYKQDPSSSPLPPDPRRPSMLPKRCSRTRRKGRHRSMASTTIPAARDWSSLPKDIMLAVFLELSAREIMQGAERACTAWRRVAVGEPALWRRVNMDTVSLRIPGARAMVRAAVDRGAGHCESFSGPFNHNLLRYLVQRAPYLKTLRLDPLDKPNEESILVLSKLPLLDDLKLSIPHVMASGANLLESVCQACPRLKRLELKCKAPFELYDNGFGMAFQRIHGDIRTMYVLRCLELCNCTITTKELIAILDNSPLLEALRIFGSLDGGMMDGKLRKKCARVKNLTLPYAHH